jgi:hypothetical protein
VQAALGAVAQRGLGHPWRCHGSGHVGGAGCLHHSCAPVESLDRRCAPCRQKAPLLVGAG